MRESLEGERKQVTVLFADLKGSTGLLADRDPEDARRLIDPVLERMMEAVHRYEGTVNQVMGDGIMALFGAPLAHEDHAVRACYAALRMQETVKRHAGEVLRTLGVPIHIRVGLNSGEVVVRSIGSDLHMDYTAVGLTTHLAARMEQMAMPGTILITPETLRLVEGHVLARSLGPLPVKGLDMAVEVFEVTGAGTAGSRMRAAVTRGLTRFVGRDDELDRLRQTVDRARAGHGQLVAVVGEPGVGKSRLYWELVHSRHTAGWLVLESFSVSYGRATPFLPVTELLKGYFRIDDRDEPRAIREKITGKLLTLAESLRPLLAAFLALFDVKDDAGEWNALSPTERNRRTLEAVKRLFHHESQVQPLLLVFEDLHWIDTETQALLDILVDSLATVRIALLVNYRPEYRHGWGSKSYYTQIRIDPLAADSADTLLQAMLGESSTLEALRRLLIERTDGNPFFLEESVRTLIEMRVLEGEMGAYRLSTPVEATHVPATVQAVVAPASTACPRRSSSSCSQPPSSARTSPSRCWRRSRISPRTTSAGDSRSCRPPSSSTRPASSPRSNTRSSTRSPSRSRTRVSCGSVGACSTRACSALSSSSSASVPETRSNCSPIMRSVATYGIGRPGTCITPARRPAGRRAIGRGEPSTNRPSRRSITSAAPRTSA
jgi:class 3 adenylate cyclase